SKASALPASMESGMGWTVALPSSSVPLGGPVATVNDRVAGDGSVLPATSVDRTATLWPPSPSVGVVQGVAQSTHAPASTRHSNTELASVDVNAKVGDASLVAPVGPEVIVVSGDASPGGGRTDAAVTVIGFIVVSLSPSASA